MSKIYIKFSVSAIVILALFIIIFEKYSDSYREYIYYKNKSEEQTTFPFLMCYYRCAKNPFYKYYYCIKKNMCAKID